MDAIAALTGQLQKTCPQLELRQEEPMHRHTSFRIGGPARLMVLPKTPQEAVVAVKAAAGMGITPFFMGNGTNLLVSDTGYDGVILKTAGGLDHIVAEGETLVVDSGVLLSRLATNAQGRSLTGLEFSHGIPGSLGGGITMNAGAYDGELSQVVQEVTCITPQGKLERFPAADCAFGYRESIFSDGTRMILNARLRLTAGDGEAVRGRMRELAQRRREKQPLEYPSAGSTFRRPPGQFAAALIDQCGLKGRTVGGAQVSEKHAGFIINRGGATCDDVLRLVEEVRQTVYDKTGTLLKLEIKRL